ncbi:hypothetical protein RRG08_052258 [Elysia crispata]|uniref:Uncharacterized protein n=1 Tax=Elysia crispata TaxID=231223 RepID=A0AAE0XE09_9GAST|nr:hypothetical protein RRG08_052258 [Elysia crispata]
MVAGRRAANCFIDTYGEVSSIQVPDERKREIHKEIKEHQVQPNPPDYMNIPFNARELEDALKALKDKKSPGPDKITNEMLKDMGPKANFQDKCHTLAVWPLLDRCHEKLLTQAAKFKRLSGHPMEKRMYQPTRGRLSRENFVHQSRCLDKDIETSSNKTPKRFPSALRSLPGAKKDISLSKAGSPMATSNFYLPFIRLSLNYCPCRLSPVSHAGSLCDGHVISRPIQLLSESVSLTLFEDRCEENKYRSRSVWMGEPAGIFTRALVNLAMEVFGWESLLDYSSGPWLTSQWKCLDGRACWDIHQGLG